MDSVSCKTPKPSSNISELFHRFSKFCKLRSFGVLTCEIPKPNNEDNGDPKTHPQPVDKALANENQDCSVGEDTVPKLFAAISALKSAYIKLQQAHIPYESKQIEAADELMVAELDSLSKLEVLYIEKQRTKPKFQPSLCLEIQEHEQLIAALQSRMQAKETEIVRLRREVEKLDKKNAALEKEMRRKLRPAEEISLLNREWTAVVFSDCFRLASKSIHDFTKPLISLMKASGWDLDQAADSIEDSVTYTERSHKKFAFEAYLSHVMLTSTQADCFNVDQFDRVMRFSDPFDALLEDPNSDFGKFCRSMYVVAVKSKMESSFFGNLDQREFVLRAGHPRTPFYQAFVKMARCVWALQVMAHSFVPKAVMFCAKGGSRFEEEYMESVVSLAMDREEGTVEVGLTVMPGFKVGSNVVRCRVYPCKLKS